MLARLGVWEKHTNRPPGKIVLIRGLRRILDMFAADAILQDYRNKYRELSPFVKQLLA